MMFICSLVFFLSFYFGTASPTNYIELKNSTCIIGCHELVEGKINVHLVPHSHDDVGWLKTYNEYYVGTGIFDTIAQAGVKYILDSTIEALKTHPDRRFIQVETAFFFKWWNDQTNETREIVKNMVNNGQLEMINGGWSMNDEATTHYHSIIDQFTWGFRFLEETVGECSRPKIGWQIDPFGHSREHASIVKQLGFEGLVVGRIDYRDKNQRIEDKNLDFVWNTNDNFDNANIFTTMFPNFYTFEEGFCFDVYCNDEELSNDNLAQKVASFKNILNKYKNYYKSHNMLIPMGHDFSYQKAEKNFRNIDKLIEGFKSDDTYNLIYSTPSCYIKAVKDEVEKENIELQIKSDDFFPYASSNHAFWTGYFSSRPTLKRFERDGNKILQTVKHLTSFSRIKGKQDDENINKLRMAMGVMQHHDAITGTEKQAVANDYVRILSEAIAETEDSVSNVVIDLLKKSESTKIDLQFKYCLRSNMSICDDSRKDRFVVAVYNPLSKTISHYVKLPVDGENYKVTGSEDNEEIQVDIFDTIHSFEFVTDGFPANKELIFLAKNVPPLGIKIFFIEKLNTSENNYHEFETIGNNRSFGDNINGFTIDDTGKIESATINGENLNIQQDFYYYKGFGTSYPKASGAYVFRPDGSAIMINSKLTTVKYARGNLVDKVYQLYSDEISQIIQVYKSTEDRYIEFDWLVGNLQIIDSEGKEIITKFTVTDTFDNKGVFYTDANGRQQIKRIRNTRNDYKYNTSEEPVSSNYYPITSKIVIKDEIQNLQVAVLNDRAQGGSSMEDDTVELMIHRRDTHDDGFGVDEILNEKQYGLGLYARGQHYLTFAKKQDDNNSPNIIEKDIAVRKLLSSLVLIADGNKLTLENIQELLDFKFSGLKSSLPENVQILTLEPWKDSYILRLEHIFEKNEDDSLSKEVSVDLKELFTLFNITEIVEVTLGANQNFNKISTEGVQTFTPSQKTTLNWTREDSELIITLKPMEIKTFLFKTDKTNEGGHNIGIKYNTYDKSSSSPSFTKSIRFFLVVILIFMILL